MRRWLFGLLGWCALVGSVGSAAPTESGRITQLKPLYPRTVIAAAGAVRTRIVLPAGDDWTAAGQALAAAIEQATGVRSELVRDTALVADDWSAVALPPDCDSLLALGTIGSNRLLAYLWAEGYTAEDDGFSGRGGWVLRTIHDPFATGLNLVELGGSSPDAVREAIAPFVERLQPGEGADAPAWLLPAPVLLVQRGEDPAPYLHAPGAPKPHRLYRYDSPAEFAANLDERVAAVRSRDQNEAKAKVPTFVSVTTVMAELADAWFHTGDEGYARLLKRLVDDHRDLIAVIPERVEMEAASAAAMAWWDVIEELPVWTDEDRLLLTNAFLADARQGHEHTPAHDLVDEGVVQVVTENHGTASATHTFDHWRYFSKYYDLPDEAYWTAVVRAIFSGQLASFQILEDASLYTPFCPGHTIDYALKSHDMRYLTSGIAATQLDFLMRAAYSNIGYSSGFGDSRFIQTPWLWTPVARSVVFTHDPVAQWWWRHYLPVECGIDTFTAETPLLDEVDPTPPTAGTGLEVVPIYRQALGFEKASRELVMTPKEPAGDEWFNKVIFRDAWSPDAAYLLLDGAASWFPRPGEPPGPKGHNQNDINSIITFTAESRMWLIDHTYSLRAIQDHNSLTITRDGVMTFENHLAKLHERAQSERFAVSRSTFDDYSGATWERTIFWRRGAHFLVLDRVIADEPGEFTVRAAWRGLGEYALRDDELRLEQAGRFAQVRSDGTAGLGVTEVPLPDASSWKVYPHAKPVAKVMDQLQSAALQPGEAIAFANLLKASADPAALDATAVRRLDDHRVLVHDGKVDTLYGLGNLDDTTACAAYAVSGDAALLVGVTRLAGQTLKTEEPVNIVLPVGTASLGFDEAKLREHLNAVLAAAVRAPGVTMGGDAPSGAATPVTVGPALATGVRQLQEVTLEPGADPLWLVTGGDGLSAFDTAGRLRWRFSPGTAAGALTVADVDGDGVAEILIGADDNRVYLVDAAGRERWHFDCEATTGGRPPVPDEIHVVDLDGDGGSDIVVVANFVHVLRPDGSVRWEDYWRFQRNRKVGDVRAVDFADLDDDGRLDIAAGIRLNYSVALAWDADGQRIYPRDPAGQPDHKPLRVHLPNDILAVDLFADGGTEQLVVAANDELSLRWTGGDRDTLSGGDFSGGCVALAQVDRLGQRPLILTATDMGAVFAYSATGERADGLQIALKAEWRQILGDPITVLTTVQNGDQTLVLVGTRRGSVRVIDAASGRTLAQLPSATAPMAAAWVARGQVWFVGEDGVVRSVAQP